MPQWPASFFFLISTAVFLLATAATLAVLGASGNCLLATMHLQLGHVQPWLSKQQASQTTQSGDLGDDIVLQKAHSLLYHI